MRRILSVFAAGAVLAGGLASGPTPAHAARAPATAAGDDVTVVAIIDNTFSPYHWDYLASKMPQAKNQDPSDDLPLDTPPHEWLAGFPSPRGFHDYSPIRLTLEDEQPYTLIKPLNDADNRAWKRLRPSVGKKVNYYWLPGTKVIGALGFGKRNRVRGTPESHGTGTTSVAVGNLHGTCPECLLVYISALSGRPNAAERAIDWAMRQPWIDVVSNSYGHSNFMGTKVYDGPTVPAQRSATERGQTVFFSAGNGVDNSYIAANPTYMSSQKGPDWIVTVGAISPNNHGSYVGHGKPADVAGLGSDYPSSFAATQVASTTRFFGGTSNAAPTVAGTFARALYLARRDLGGPSRAQRDGVIARGSAYACGRARPRCELGDGILTAKELRTRLLHGAVHTIAGTTDPLGAAAPPAAGEDEFLNEGHGSYFGRETGVLADWLKEFERVMAPLEGRRATLKRPAGEREWMIVDSFCRQRLWGHWREGYYLRGKTALPGPDPNYPVRSGLEASCQLLSDDQ